MRISLSCQTHGRSRAVAKQTTTTKMPKKSYFIIILVVDRSCVALPCIRLPAAVQFTNEKRRRKKHEASLFRKRCFSSSRLSMWRIRSCARACGKRSSGTCARVTVRTHTHTLCISLGRRCRGQRYCGAITSQISLCWTNHVNGTTRESSR